MSSYIEIETGGHVPVKAWIAGLPMEERARKQLINCAQLPIVYKWVAAMPDVHYGKGATVGSVIPTLKAIIPAAVGVDIGCGMMAVKTSLTASDLPTNLAPMRTEIEKAIPHGRTSGGKNGDRGAWQDPPESLTAAWLELEPGFKQICSKHREIKNANNYKHLGTLGTGNHFVEVCIDESQDVWFMLHSGSRGVGNRIGTHFIELARRDMEGLMKLPDQDLSYLREGTQYFDDYVEAVSWAQNFARLNRELMMESMIAVLRKMRGLPRFKVRLEAVNCHHNYVSRERHYGEEVWVTRKGAVRAGQGQLGIIPGSMGASSYIVRGKGHPESFESCSHGAGRLMSRGEALRRFSVKDHIRATEGVECRKDGAVLDETPMAYKPIDKVMAAQSELVEIVHSLKQVICVKG